jgi:hypothetical protein
MENVGTRVGGNVGVLVEGLAVGIRVGVIVGSAEVQHLACIVTVRAVSHILLSVNVCVTYIE